MNTIYEKLTDFLLSRLQGKSFEYVVIMSLIAGGFFLQYRLMGNMVEQKNEEIGRLLAEHQRLNMERERYLQAYIECASSNSAEVKKTLDEIRGYVMKYAKN